MYLKFVVVLFLQLFSTNNCILLPNQSQRIIKLPVLPVQRPSMNPNYFQT